MSTSGLANGQAHTGRSVTLLTLVKFLAGHSDAIRAVAGSKGALWLGLAFVLVAGLAREYDQKDLLAEPWWLIVPLLVSLALAFVQFLFFWILRTRSSTLSTADAFRAFLTCFWMTAPLALLYAIPYERWNDDLGAATANYRTLALVSLWRGVLICRVLMVLARVSFLHALMISALLGDAVMLIALAVLPVPIFDVMGGLSYTPAVANLASTAFLARTLGMLALIVLVPAGLYFFASGKPTWTEGSFDRHTSLSRPLWILPAAAIIGLLAALPFTQPPQRLAKRATDLLVANRLDEAVALMDQHQRADFPPLWRPLPIRGMPIQQPDLLDVTDRAVRLETDSWVRAFYLDEACRIYLSSYFTYGGLYGEDELVEQWDHFLALLNTIPEGDSIRKAHANEISGINQSINSMREQPAFIPSPTTQSR